jgi:hypothetical protein
VHSPTPEGVGTPDILECSIASGQSLASRPPWDFVSISGELSTWATPQILHFIWASTDQLEQRITIVKQANQSLTQQTKSLHEVVTEATAAKAIEQNLWVQAESTVAAIVDKFSQVWPSFHQVIPELPEDITPVVPPD